MKILSGVLIGLLVIAVAGLFVFGRQSRTDPPTLGVAGAQLTGCPESPNCVSSSATGDHGYPAWRLKATTAWTDVAAQLVAMDGATVIENDPNGYLRAEFRSAVFGFIDDFELLMRDQQLAVRSSSRVGHSDLGANRKRADELGRRLAEAGLVAES